MGVRFVSLINNGIVIVKNNEVKVLIHNILFQYVPLTEAIFIVIPESARKSIQVMPYFKFLNLKLLIEKCSSI
jgi:hypothetical protein